MWNSNNTSGRTTGYLNEMRRFRMLKPEEEFELARRWREAGDAQAANKLITSHLRLVAKMAFGYRGYGLPTADVISEGSIGLIKAVNRFDPAKGVRLSTYARWWIRACIQEFILRSWSLVRIGTTSSQKKLFFNLSREKSRISALGEADLHPGQLAAIADALHVREGDVAEMNGRMRGDLSLNAPLNEDEGDGEWQDRISDQQPDQESILAQSQVCETRKGALRTALTILDARERHIFVGRQLSEPPLKLDELAGKFRISRERVRQIELRAFQKVQRAARAELVMVSCDPRLSSQSPAPVYS